MATIPRELIDDYTRQLNQISQAAKKTVAAQLEGLTFTSIADLREQVIAILESVCGASTDLVAAYAAEFYDAIRTLETGSAYGAQAVSMRNPEATQNAVRGMVQTVVDGKPIEQFYTQVLQRVDYENKKAAGDCVQENLKRDPKGKRWARVPTGNETCDFCIMLASRGFVYTSEKNAANFGNHYHAGCDCRVVPGFANETKIPGYDPDALYQQWKESALKTYQGKKSHEAKQPESKPGTDGEYKDVRDYVMSAESEEQLNERLDEIKSEFHLGET